MPATTELASYRRDGFVIVPNLVPQAHIQVIATAFEDLKKQASTFTEDTFIGPTYFNLHRDCDPFDKKIVNIQPVPGELRRVTYPYLVSETLNKYRVWDPMLRVVEQILGKNIVQLVNQINFNPPKRGTGWGWHQDYRFRRSGLVDARQNFVQCIMAVDRCSKLNGGIRLVPRSDELGSLTLDTNPEDFDRYMQPEQIVQPDLEPGDIIFFNPYVVHGSTPNLSEHDRRVYINGFAAAAAVTHGIEVMRNGIIIPHAVGVMEFEDDPMRLPPVVKY